MWRSWFAVHLEIDRISSGGRIAKNFGGGEAADVGKAVEFAGEQSEGIEDVAEAALLLAGDKFAKTTGAMIPVDGGLKDAFPR